MRYTIKPRQGDPLTFWAPDSGGYIRLESNGRSGMLGRRICDRGDFMGALSARSEADLKATVRRWYRQNKRTCGY